jgi:hypothetical protein
MLRSNVTAAMSNWREMTPTSRRFAKALVSKFPRFANRLRILPSGDFEAAILAPRNSKAGTIVCQSHGADVWVRFGPAKQPAHDGSIDTEVDANIPKPIGIDILKNHFAPDAR